MHSRRLSSAVTALGEGRILVAGGVVDSQPVRSAETYQASTNSWSSVSDMGTARARFALVGVAKGVVLAAGSYNLGATTASAELFSDSNGTWWQVQPMLRSRGAQGAAVLPNGTAMMIGGWSSGAITSSVEAFGKVRAPGPLYLQPIDLVPLVEAASELPGHAGNGMIAKLYAAQAKYDNSSFAVCANIMDAFLHQVRAMWQSGHMTSGHAAAIYEAYTSVMQGIGAIPEPPPSGLGT
jgi:hypothetical protein